MMLKNITITLAVIVIFLPSGSFKIMLFDFTAMDNVDDWVEISDTPNGAGFAGVRVPTHLNLSNFENINILCRGQGANSHYKIVLRHKGFHSNEDPTYEQYFTVPIPNIEFTTISLPISNFRAYYRGREIPDAEPLDTINITSFGLQMYGGVYLPIKQSGVSALEIDFISAS